ncbi:hypothetical protein L249_8871 [Ophiocordyceps polyrhachis-furcata BCC 54312]|uniref:Uncharacterized protein n=1 Tax=Ophiocordyceps polyrhachis-furcata BCC 54312 TaxID=1330021 RepID=A0A367L1R1_9HYPO|nr:hypothetical protein L249_8871 [Ophiocordyceps polyrhachis-furcata BCC 54312]
MCMLLYTFTPAAKGKILNKIFFSPQSHPSPPPPPSVFFTQSRPPLRSRVKTSVVIVQTPDPQTAFQKQREIYNRHLTPKLRMKPLAAVVIVTAAGGCVSATGISDANGVNCAKANASYCISDDVILRCNEQALGTPVHCADDVASHPHAAGCFQSTEEAGDAVCHQNCLVKNAKNPYRLPASQCRPTKASPPAGAFVESGTLSIPEGTSIGTATETGFLTIPEGPGTTDMEASQSIPQASSTTTTTTETGVLSIPEGTGTTNIETTETGVMSIPEGNSMGTSETGIMSIPEGTGTSLGMPQPPMTSSTIQPYNPGDAASSSSSSSGIIVLFNG